MIFFAEFLIIFFSEENTQERFKFWLDHSAMAHRVNHLLQLKRRSGENDPNYGGTMVLSTHLYLHFILSIARLTYISFLASCSAETAALSIQIQKSNQTLKKDAPLKSNGANFLLCGQEP